MIRREEAVLNDIEAGFNLNSCTLQGIAVILADRRSLIDHACEELRIHHFEGLEETNRFRARMYAAAGIAATEGSGG